MNNIHKKYVPLFEDVFPEEFTEKDMESRQNMLVVVSILDSDEIEWNEDLQNKGAISNANKLIPDVHVREIICGLFSPDGDLLSDSVDEELRDDVIILLGQRYKNIEIFLGRHYKYVNDGSDKNIKIEQLFPNDDIRPYRLDVLWAK